MSFPEKWSFRRLWLISTVGAGVAVYVNFTCNEYCWLDSRAEPAGHENI